MQERYDEAGPLLKRALAIGEATLGPDHPEVADILNTRAALFYVQVSLSMLFLRMLKSKHLTSSTIARNARLLWHPYLVSF